MKTKAVTGIVVTMLFLVVVTPIGVSVGVVDFNIESGDFILVMRGFPHVFFLLFSLTCLFLRPDVEMRVRTSVW